MIRAKAEGIVYLIKEKKYRIVQKGERLQWGERFINFIPSGIIWDGNIGVRIA